MGEIMGSVVRYDRGSSNGRYDYIGEGEIGTSILGESLGTGGGREIGSSGSWSGGNVDGKLEGF